MAIEKLLKKKASKTDTGAEKLIDEVKGLIEAGTREDRELLELAGLTSRLKESDRVTGNVLIKKKLKEQNGFDHFTTEEITKVCVEYNFKFRPSGEYAGTLPPEVISKIKQLKESDPSVQTDRFYVMAPPTMFTGMTKKKFQWPKFPKDPALFYRQPGPHWEEPRYSLLHEWGNDFVLDRYIRALFFRDVYKTFWFMVVLLGVTAGFLTPLAIAGSICIGLLVGFGSSYIFCSILYNDADCTDWEHAELEGRVFNSHIIGKSFF